MKEVWGGLEKKKTERRTQSQIVTAEDQPSTQSQTGKGNAGVGRGGGAEGGWCGGIERGVRSEEDIWLRLGAAVWTSRPSAACFDWAFSGDVDVACCR